MDAFLERVPRTLSHARCMHSQVLISADARESLERAAQATMLAQGGCWSMLQSLRARSWAHGATAAASSPHGRGRAPQRSYVQ